MVAFRKLLCCSIAVLCIAPILHAQIILEKEYRGKKVMCVYSGLIGSANSCGTRDYDRVLTGTVQSSTDVGDFDKRLEIKPDEVFLGDSTPVTAIANQACLSVEIKPGDKWLFYLSRDAETNALQVPYSSPSEPVAYAKDDLAMLRRLVHLTGSGILIGTIDLQTNGRPFANSKLLAKNVRDGRLYLSRTNENGFFMFELPPGRYELAPTPEYHLREVKSDKSLQVPVLVEKGACWEHSFTVGAQHSSASTK